MTQQVHVHIAGRVQGVGFRYATQRKATELGLSGWVRNRQDGSVEAVFQGPKESLERMLSWCGQGPTMSSVKKVEAVWETAEVANDSFEVRV